MGISWTEEQQEVIRARGSNILVSAAAGSGKTAVLVERIIQRITDKTNPTDIDRLLIVTFTRAAAAEMKERIGRAIEKRLEENREDEHLQRQSVLVHHAQITTIDSFCSYVVKNYFHLIDLDPSFRMGDEGEMRLLKADVAGTVLEEAYQNKENKDFFAFVDGFSQGKTDERIQELILKLYEFSMSYPYPEEWLSSCRKAYDIETEEDLEKASWMKLVMEEVKKQLEEAGDLLFQARALSGEEDGPGFYLELLELEETSVKKLQQEERFFSLREKIQGLEFKRLPPGKKAEKELVSEAKQELVKQLRSQAKDLIKSLRERYFQEDAREMLESLRAASRPVGALVNLTLGFMDSYRKKKKEKNILDFADLEHYALEILVHHKEEGDERSQAARELASRFEEIMIDEYQDSNLVQEKLLTAVSRVEEGQNNIFMVGDVKQSIYRFRLARPDLFMEKFHTYPTSPGGSSYRIDLHKNFRSRAQVLESVNYLFYQIMGRDLGGVEYDTDAALYPKGEFPPLEQEQGEAAVEVLLLEGDDPVWDQQDQGENHGENQGQNQRELEARMAALRIRELMDSAQVTDKSTGQLRKARYSDFTILLRTMSGWAETFKRILNSLNIPASVTTKTGYFSAPEVAQVLDYLQILDNPRQDIPLAGALRNLPEGFDFQELSLITVTGKEKETCCLYDSLLEAGKQEGPLGEKVRNFLDTYEELRAKVPYTPIHELIWDFFQKTGFLRWQEAFVSGEQRKANLMMLLEKARDYESTSYRGLFNFVRYIENLKKYQVDFGEASLLTEKEDTVRIMSIHGSKGLEFPIVIAAGMGKQTNLQDARESMVLHPDLGIGAPYVEEKLRIRTRTILQRAIQQEITLESLGEELRILYVALTRAKEKLILTGTVSKLEEKLKGYEILKRQQEEKLPYGLRTRGKSYMDWILAALSRHKSMKGLYEAFGLTVYALNPLYEGPGNFLIRRVSPLELVLGETGLRRVELEEKARFLNWNPDRIYEEEIRKELEEAFSYEYPYEDLAQIPAKLTVSQIKGLLSRQEEDSQDLYPQAETEDWNRGCRWEKEDQISPEEPVQENQTNQEESAQEDQTNHQESVQEEELEEPGYVPAFMRPKEEILTGADRGTAYHKILECLDYRDGDSLEAVKRQIERLYQKGYLTEAMKASVWAGDIYSLVQSPLGRRMKKAAEQELLHREQPFVLAVPACEVREEYRTREELLIQGIIDAYFEEEGDLVLVDYKTDKVPKARPGELTEKYKVQLQYYRQALERLTGKKVKETYIYSLFLGTEILVAE